jgi:hypothetical protein
MDLEQIVKETVAKMVDEKTLTAAEKKKKEELVMAMKKDFKGPEAAMYAIATDKAKKLAEGGDEDHEVSMAQNSLDSIIRSAMELKAKIGDQEINIPAWIQDHITNSENFIDQASQGYHEYENEGGHEELNEDNLQVKSIAKQIYSVLKQNGVNAKLIASIPSAGPSGKSIGATLTGDSNEALVYYWDDTKTKLTTIEIYLSGAKDEVLNFEKKILSSFPALEQYSRQEFVSPQAFKLVFRVKEKTTAKGGIQELDEDKMDKEELKQAQIEKAYDQLEKMKANTRLFSKEDIKKAEARIEKLEDELDALAEKSVNEAFDELTVRRWQHYAGIK